MDKYKNFKMNEQELDTVAGGQTYWFTRITGAWTDPATGRRFKDGYLIRGKVTVEFNTGSSANIYKRNGSRISRYEALVWLARGNGKGNFNLEPYLGDSHSDNKGRNIND